MSGARTAQYSALRIECEVMLDNIISTMKSYGFRKEVEDKIMREYGITGAIHSIGILDSYITVEQKNAIMANVNRARSFLSNVETYVVYNFNLDVKDYNQAIREAAEELTYSSNEIIDSALEQTKDELLKTYIRSTASKKNYKSTEELIEVANKNMLKSGLHKKRTLQNAKKVLEAKNIKQEKLDEKNIANLITDTNQKEADVEITKEVRNRVLTSIIKIIREQGFIVKRNNIEECDDHAKISAIKPNGEQANFVVYLDGKFIYKFHEYEGSACEKDIENFEEKFDSIYGIKIEDKKITWSNPDRIGKMSHQRINTRNIGG